MFLVLLLQLHVSGAMKTTTTTAARFNVNVMAKNSLVDSLAERHPHMTTSPWCDGIHAACVPGTYWDPTTCSCKNSDYPTCKNPCDIQCLHCLPGTQWEQENCICSQPCERRDCGEGRWNSQLCQCDGDVNDDGGGDGDVPSRREIRGDGSGAGDGSGDGGSGGGGSGGGGGGSGGGGGGSGGDERKSGGSGNGSGSGSSGGGDGSGGGGNGSGGGGDGSGADDSNSEGSGNSDGDVEDDPCQPTDCASGTSWDEDACSCVTSDPLTTTSTTTSTITTTSSPSTPIPATTTTATPLDNLLFNAPTSLPIDCTAGTGIGVCKPGYEWDRATCSCKTCRPTPCYALGRWNPNKCACDPRVPRLFFATESSPSTLLSSSSSTQTQAAP